MNTQEIKSVIETLPKRHSFLSIAYDLRDAFKDKAEKLSVYNSSEAIKEIDTLTDLLINLRTIVKAAEAAEVLHSLTSTTNHTEQ